MGQAPGASVRKTRFIVHHHKANRPHFDLRLLLSDTVRSWSLLLEPPSRLGIQRLAIERESGTPEEIQGGVIVEEAFGPGRAYVWDEGDAEITSMSAMLLVLELRGAKLSGRYKLQRMRWYPGNRWILRKEGSW